MEILEVHLDSWAVGGFAHPYVEVLAFAGFEEENIIAVVEFGQFVELVQFRFRIEFRFLATVGKESVEVIEEVSMSINVGCGLAEFGARVPRYLPVSHTSRTNDQDSLLNLLLTIGSFRSRSVCFAERLINCGHVVEFLEAREHRA